jgi:hypothetical protein
LKITDCLELIKASTKALEAAPQKGFVDLDMVKNTLRVTGDLLTGIMPELELGNKLKEDFQNNLKAKLRVLKLSGDSLIIGQAENALLSGNLEFDDLKSLQKEIDRAFEKIFGGQTKHPISGQPPKIEDYQ